MVRPTECHTTVVIGLVIGKAKDGFVAFFLRSRIRPGSCPAVQETVDLRWPVSFASAEHTRRPARNLIRQ